MDDVGILLAEKWVKAVFDATHVSDKIMFIKLVAGKSIMTAVGLCSQACLDDSVKDLFYENVQWTLTRISASEILFVCEDFNSHTEKNADWYEGVHYVRQFIRCNLEGERILEFAVAHNLVVSNSLLMKRESHLVTFQSSKNQSQNDYILVMQQNVKLVCDVKVIPNEECVTQHKLLVYDARILKKKRTVKEICTKTVSMGKCSKLIFMIKFCETFTGEINYTSGKEVDNISRLKQGLLSAAEKTCGWTKKGIWRKQTSWCNDKVSKDISEKRRMFKLWKTGGSKDKYLDAKRKA